MPRSVNASKRSVPSDAAAVAPPSGDRGGLTALATFCALHARTLLAAHALLAVLLGVLGAGAFTTLSSGGYTASGTEAARAETVLARQLGAGSADMTVHARTEAGVDSAAARAAGRHLSAWAADSKGVRQAVSYWDTGQEQLRSVDGRAALLRLDLEGDEFAAMRTAERLTPGLAREAGVLEVEFTGPAVVNSEASRQSQRDLLRAELIVLPLTFTILVLAFGSLVAALLPTVTAAGAVAGAFAVLRLVNEFTPMSVFALNIAAALGFGLAVDYALFVVTRFRDELAGGHTVTDAVVRSMRTAGRTALYSALTVAAVLAVVLVFPVPFLRSLAIAGITVVLLGAAVTVTALPALLALTGHRVNRWDPLSRWRSGAGRTSDSATWRAIAQVTTGRPVLSLCLSIVVLVLMAVPFAHARFGIVDARVLPADTPARVTAQHIDEAFSVDSDRTLAVALPGTNAWAGREQLDAYAARLSQLSGVGAVQAATGVYRHGSRVETAPAGVPGAVAPQGTWLAVSTTAPPQSDAAHEVLHRVRQLPAPGPRLVGGRPAQTADTLAVMSERLPSAALLAAMATLTVLLAFTRALLVPVKAVVVAALSLTASLGALVWIFQEGHGRGLVGDFTVTGHLETTMPLLMFTLAFGASVDYELFLMARIKEEYLATGDHIQAIITGIARTGRLVTAAALVVAVAMTALASSGITMLKVLGVGLAIAVLVDATIVRGVLVPAAMRLTGAANWWMPRLSRRPPRTHTPGAPAVTGPATERST
ncbi:MMPL family transporter [Streptomyces atroolivaceus]|uniref:MMPL family transporter n=1 Tax=Streptomyces atroolivaceus TaxID=66869 RepID=UPI0036A92A0E